MNQFIWALVGSIAAAWTLPAKSVTKTYNLDREHVPGQLIVGLEDDIPEEIRTMIIRQLDQYGEGAGPRVSSLGGTFLLESYNLQRDSSLHDLAKYIDSLPGVRFVEANNIYYLQERVPNDPFFDRLYGLRNGEKQSHIGARDINATLAWEKTTGSREIVVAVLDTGIDYLHPDLVDNIWNNPGEIGSDDDGNNKNSNRRDDDNNGYVDDWRGWNAFDNNNNPMDGHGHGTHVAGTIGAIGDNGIGVVGVNWEVSLVPVKIFSDSGMTNTAAIVTGIDYSTAIGAHVTNNSWGGGAYSDAIYEAISRANDAGILFVAAAGNSSSNNDSFPHYPSSYELPNIIGVASTDRNDRLSGFSSYGATTVHVAAPGSDIYSTEPNGRYGFKSGTSMATPHVAGLVALVKSYFPELTHLQIKDRILATSVRIPSLEGRVIHGRIDAFSALQIDEIPPSAPGEPRVEFAGIRSLSLSWLPSGDDGDEGEASRYEVRKSDQPISEDNWSLAQPVRFSIVSSDSERITADLEGMTFNDTGYVAIKAFDNVGNESEISESIHFQLSPVVPVFENAGDISNGFDIIEGTWASVELDGRLIISDSPGGHYQNNSNFSLISQSIAVSTADLVLELRTQFDLETRYDYGYIEVQTDGQAWNRVETLNGRMDWHTIYVDLRNHLNNSESFRLRFRIETDSSVTRPGWDIDSIRILGPAAD